MKIQPNLLLKVSLITLLLSACTAAKLEARLEANPQCKEVINPKTGSLMPCPGSDKSFYVAAGLEEPRKPKTALVANTSAAENSSAGITQISSSGSQSNPVQAQNKSATSPVVQIDCKPKIHQKTGGTLPCPPLD